MLQIFVRPEAADEEPIVQFVELDEIERNDQWRLLTGPKGSDAPTFVRQAVYLYDTHLSAGRSIDLPSKPGFDRWLYVFQGRISAGQHDVGTHTALMLAADQADMNVIAVLETDLVVFLVDRSAKFSRGGTISG
jgi:redox-sensitive bicupin YhaK (pirin superfamily)